MAQKRILLMRHAEKIGDRSDIHLSPAGRARAARLADYIPATFGTPRFLIATAPSPHSIRPIETITPLSNAIGVPVSAIHTDDAYGVLARELLSLYEFDRSLIVVCWHHGKLPHLAHALGAMRGSYPEPWDEQVFNLILDLTYDMAGPPALRRVEEPF